MRRKLLGAISQNALTTIIVVHRRASAGCIQSRLRIILSVYSSTAESELGLLLYRSRKIVTVVGARDEQDPLEAEPGPVVTRLTRYLKAVLRIHEHPSLGRFR